MWFAKFITQTTCLPTRSGGGHGESSSAIISESIIILGVVGIAQFTIRTEFKFQKLVAELPFMANIITLAV
uniref:Uncharacterized protein n=1 Tax=Glossina austeni TaxID=7395 RepID=A0A1A9UVC4_GLOAU